MLINSAQFVISNTDISKCPNPNLPEFAFIGRSNVGKSSLINMLTQRNKLAKTSGKPGKTQLINHFIINKEWYMVDLPGYGFAKTSKTNRKSWKKFIEEYLLTRTNLMCVFVLIDSRLDLQKIDKEFMGWLSENGVPYVIAYTKTDKLSKTKLPKQIKIIEDEMLNYWEELPLRFLTSSENKIGADKLLNFIKETNKLFESI